MRPATHAMLSILVTAAALVCRCDAQTTQPSSEADKIRALIDHVRNLGEGVVFIRNDEEHTPADAANHMQLKWNSAGDRIKTARDFITHCASKSSMSGKPYVIRFPDKREVPSGEYLNEQLGGLESPAR